MKKLLVVLMAAMMVFSLAAVSMAAATVEGDWRVEWSKDESKQDDIDYTKTDLRFNFKGKVSDTIDAYAQIAIGDGIGSTSTSGKNEIKVGVDDDGKPIVIKNDISTKGALPITFKEYYVTFKQSFGTIKAGMWDNKLVPSRVLLKPHGFNAVKNDLSVLVDIPVGDALTFGVWFPPTMVDEKAFDLKAAYKGDSFGAEVHYGDKNTEADDDEYIAVDAYYNITDSIKVFAYAIQTDSAKGLWQDELAPVVGATFKNIAGSKLTASLEYALEETKVDYTEYAVQLKYGFNNKVNLEVEYQTVDADNNKIIIRPRVKF